MKKRDLNYVTFICHYNVALFDVFVAYPWVSARRVLYVRGRWSFPYGGCATIGMCLSLSCYSVFFCFCFSFQFFKEMLQNLTPVAMVTVFKHVWTRLIEMQMRDLLSFEAFFVVVVGMQKFPWFKWWRIQRTLPKITKCFMLPYFCVKTEWLCCAGSSSETVGKDIMN